MARVFLADCQPLFNEALEALITRDGTNEVVGQASAVPQIVASVPQLKPDLFVLDAGLALSSRPTLVETILAELPDTKVILLAQDTDIDLLLHAIRAGAVGVVGKKSGTQTVLRAVQAVLDGEGVVPRAMLPQLFRRLLDLGDLWVKLLGLAAVRLGHGVVLSGRLDGIGAGRPPHRSQQAGLR